MLKLDMIILYVADAAKSAAFYQTLLGQPPVHAEPTFAMFMLEGGLRLSLWSRHAVKPAVDAAAGATEISFTVNDIDALTGLHADWASKSITIAQPIIKMDFGETFTALDPDGHRIRASVMQTRD